MKILNMVAAGTLLILSVFSSAQSIPLAYALHTGSPLSHSSIVNCSDTAELPDDKIDSHDTLQGHTKS